MWLLLFVSFVSSHFESGISVYTQHLCYEWTFFVCVVVSIPLNRSGVVIFIRRFSIKKSGRIKGNIGSKVNRF